MEPENQPQKDTPDNRDAAARVVRDQLDAIYEKQSGAHSQSSRDNYSAYRQHQKNQRSKSNHRAQPEQDEIANVSKEHLNRYHTEWQEYYQRYYEQYYVGHLHKALEDQKKQNISSPSDKEIEVNNIRNRIRQKAKEKAFQARKSRHFLPIVSGFVAIFVVSFLQFNQMIIGSVQAYVSPGAINPQNIVVDPTSDNRVGPEPKLIIPKINVDVPVVYNVGPDHESQMAAMQKGVAHFAIPGAESVPGQIGNTVLSGHSSNDLFDPGDYKFIFVQLDKLAIGDTIYANFDSVRYTYSVTKKEVVMPNQVDKLTYETDKPVLTLITCTPIGTAEKRLLVTAEQISPDTSQAKKAEPSSNTTSDKMSGNAPTIIERLFGAR